MSIRVALAFLGLSLAPIWTGAASAQGGPTLYLDPRNPNRVNPSGFPLAPASVVREAYRGFNIPPPLFNNPLDYTPNGAYMTPAQAPAFNAATTVTPYSYPGSNGTGYDPYGFSGKPPLSPMDAALAKKRAFDPNAAATLNGFNPPLRKTSRSATHRGRKSSRKKK